MGVDDMFDPLLLYNVLLLVLSGNDAAMGLRGCWPVSAGITSSLWYLTFNVLSVLFVAQFIQSLTSLLWSQCFEVLRSLFIIFHIHTSNILSFRAAVISPFIAEKMKWEKRKKKQQQQLKVQFCGHDISFQHVKAWAKAWCTVYLYKHIIHRHLRIFTLLLL